MGTLELIQKMSCGWETSKLFIDPLHRKKLIIKPHSKSVTCLHKAICLPYLFFFTMKMIQNLSSYLKIHFKCNKSYVWEGCETYSFKMFRTIPELYKYKKGSNFARERDPISISVCSFSTFIWKRKKDSTRYIAHI